MFVYTILLKFLLFSSTLSFGYTQYLLHASSRMPPPTPSHIQTRTQPHLTSPLMMSIILSLSSSSSLLLLLLVILEGWVVGAVGGAQHRRWFTEWQEVG